MCIFVTTSVLKGMPPIEGVHAQGAATDSHVVAAVWAHMQQVLVLDQAETGTYIKQMTQLLPPLDSVPPQDLPAIVRLHLQSAAHLKGTMKLVAPDAFAAGDTESNVEALVDALPSTAAAMVAKLIDFQIFHLTRVREVVAHMRSHAAARRRALAAACAPTATASSLAGTPAAAAAAAAVAAADRSELSGTEQ